MELIQKAMLHRARTAMDNALGIDASATTTKAFRDLVCGLARARSIDDMGLFAGSEHPVLKDWQQKALLLGDAVWASSDVAQLVASFRGSIAPVSLLDQLAAYAVNIPADTLTALIVSGFSVDVVAEGFPKAVHGLDLSKLPVTPQKAAGLVVLSQELFNTVAGEAVFLRELQKAALRATNTAVLNIALANSPTVSAAGGATLTGLRNALAVSQPSDGYVVTMSSAAIAQFATLAEVRGDLGPRGGTFVPGIHFVPNDELDPAVKMVVVAASHVAFVDHGVSFKPSRQANVELSDTPTSPVAATTVLTSLFQSGLVALLVEHAFRIAIPDDSVVLVGA